MKKKVLIILSSILLLFTSFGFIVYYIEVDNNGLDGLMFVKLNYPDESISFRKDSVTIIDANGYILDYSYTYDKKLNTGKINTDYNTNPDDNKFKFQNELIYFGEDLYYFSKTSSKIKEGTLLSFIFKIKDFSDSVYYGSINSLNSFSFKSLKKYIPFTEDPCKNLEGVYIGKVSTLLLLKTLTYTLTEDKTEFYDGKVSMLNPEFIDNIYQNVTYNGVYRKIGEEVEIELFEKDGRTRKGLKKFRIERDQNGCILKLEDGLVLERQSE